MWRVVGESKLMPKSVTSHLSQTTSFVVCMAAMYSASVLERATGCCFFEDQLTAAPPSMKAKPDMDFLSFTLLAQSVLTKLCSAVPLVVLCLKMRHLWLVALRYQNAQLSAC